MYCNAFIWSASINCRFHLQVNYLTSATKIIQVSENNKNNNSNNKVATLKPLLHVCFFRSSPKNELTSFTQLQPFRYSIAAKSRRYSKFILISSYTFDKASSLTDSWFIWNRHEWLCDEGSNANDRLPTFL